MDYRMRQWRRGGRWTASLAFTLMTLTSPAILAQQGSNTGKESIASWSAGDSVNTLAVSADGQRIVALAAATKLKVWDSTGKELLSLQVADALNSVTMSADGKRLASGSSTGKLWVWDADGKEIFSVNGHGNSVRGVAFSPDGTRIATASQDKTAKLWDAQTGKNLLELAHAHHVLCVAFSPDGKKLATGGQDNTARVWDTETGKELVVLKNLNAEVSCVAFAPDGERFATGTNLIQVWDAGTGKPLASIKGQPGRSQGIAFSPDGKYLVAGGGEYSVAAWDSRSGKEMFRLLGHEDAVRAFAFTADGKRLVSGGQDQTVRVWDASRPDELIAQKRPGERPEVLRLTADITDKMPKDIGFGGNYAMRVPVTLTEGKTYQIDMSGISLGQLRLVDPAGKHLTGDNSTAGFSSPRIIHEAKVTGRYSIVCTSWHLRPETGRFTLVVRESTSDPKELARPIELRLVKGRAEVEAELELRGPRYKDNPCKFLTIALKAGVTYRVEMSSREFLSNVFVEDPDGKLVGENHIKSGDAKPASVTFTAGKAGVYRVIAAQYDFRTGGPQFRLIVEELKSP